MNKEATTRVGWQDKHIFCTSELILGINLHKTVIKLSPDEKVLEQLPYIFEQQKNSSIWESFILQKENLRNETS